MRDVVVRKSVERPKTLPLVFLPIGDSVGGATRIVGAAVLSAVGTTMSCKWQVTTDQQYLPVPHSACKPVLQCVSREHSLAALVYELPQKNVLGKQWDREGRYDTVQSGLKQWCGSHSLRFVVVRNRSVSWR